MAHGQNRVVQQHSGARKPHNLPDFLALFRPVTFDFALAAKGFGLNKRALVNALIGIIQQAAALFAKLLSGFMLLCAIYRNHKRNHFFLFVP